MKNDDSHALVHDQEGRLCCESDVPLFSVDSPLSFDANDIVQGQATLIGCGEGEVKLLTALAAIMGVGRLTISPMKLEVSFQAANLLEEETARSHVDRVVTAFLIEIGATKLG